MACSLIARPTTRSVPPSAATADTASLRRHVTTLSQTYQPRNSVNTANLDLCAEYIARLIAASPPEIGVELVAYTHWPHGIPAAMVTNTAFYRNREYHTPNDTADRLDYDRLAMVVVAVHQAIRHIAAGLPAPPSQANPPR